MSKPGAALRAVVVPLATAALIAGAACGDGDASGVTLTATPAAGPPPTRAVAPSLTATATPEPTSPASSLTSPRILAAGEFRLPAAASFDQPGFHEVLVATHDLPPQVDMTGGSRLVLRLWDAGRTQQTCSRDHPLSGCATVDWSDFEGRPGVPPGGVFDNSLTVQLASGPHTFFLTEKNTLVDEPNEYAPG